MTPAILVIIGSGNSLCPVGTKPLPEPLMTFCQWDIQEYISMKFDRKKLNITIQINCIWNHPQNIGYFFYALMS